jgi:protoheme IX farnesyltransferase
VRKVKASGDKSLSVGRGIAWSIWPYIDVLKPRETSLLTFIGVCAAIAAAGGYPSLNRLLFLLVTILIASAGANALTNYLDRGVDAKMQRTCRRALPSGRINPPEKALPLSITLTVGGLVMAWFLHPLCFVFDFTGTVAAVVWRKKNTCIFPQGTIAGCAPVLMGWLAINPTFNPTIILLCVLIGVWIPLHVWSVMIAHRDDYLGAGLLLFPLTIDVRKAMKLLLALSAILYPTSIALYFVAHLGLVYLVAANILGIAMLYTSSRLTISGASKDAWKLYKLSAFPYLGLLFLSVCLDLWLM